MTEERVVLVDAAGQAVGSAPKSAVHGPRTPLHLAFSCYVFDDDGRVLLSRRAHHKITWPGVWTNSCCGHPLPGEPVAAAVARRLAFELGLEARSLDLLLPTFSYRATMENGTVEHELCPVYRAVTSGTPRPNPAEVADVRWLPWAEFAAAVRTGVLAPPADGTGPAPEAAPVSPWCRRQVPLLDRLGPDPLAWPVADESALPPAARAGLA